MRLISSHLDWTSLFNKGWKQRFRFVKNQWITCLVREPGKNKATAFVIQYNTHKSCYIFFGLSVFCRFLRLYGRHCPRITNLVSLLHAIFSFARTGKMPIRTQDSLHTVYGRSWRWDKCQNRNSLVSLWIDRLPNLRYSSIVRDFGRAKEIRKPV